ncbi:hypothetical protein ACXX82_00230 [Glaciimonas sp. GNP009]
MHAPLQSSLEAEQPKVALKVAARSVLNLDVKKLRDTASEGLIIDCREIRLVQNGTDTPRKWLCAGSIEVDFRKGITTRLVIFGEDKPIRTVWDQLLEASKVKSGEVFPASSYFTLTAIDVDGNEWSNPIVQVTEQPSESCTVVTVECNWIRCVSTSTENTDSVHMLFLEDLDFPLNSMKSNETKSAGGSSSHFDRSGSQGEIDNAIVLYNKANAPEHFCELIVKAKSNTAFPLNYSAKLVEAVRFMTASQKSFAVSDCTFGIVRTMEFAKAPPAQNGLFPPPLDARPNESDDFYRLLNAYLANALATSTGDNFSPISSKLYRLYNLKEVSLDAIALLVSVTVEGLTQDSFPSLGAASPTQLADIDKLLAAIRGANVSDKSRERALGTVGGMKSSRAADKLYALEKFGKITSGEIQAWKSLRDRAAHGNMHTQPSEFQKLLDDVYQASTLLNKLTLLAIGYDGRFTDYSKKGWPIRDSVSLPAAPLST